MKATFFSSIAGVAMLACAALANSWQPVPVAPPESTFEAAIPAEFAGWRIDRSVIPIAPTPDVQANLDKLYGQIVSRAYVNERGQRMMLVVAYGGDQSDSLKAHRQEVCYAAQGFAIREVRRDRLALAGSEVPLVRVLAQKGNRSEPVSYWFTMGDRVVIDRADRLFAQVRHGLAGEIPDGVLVRVSSLSRDAQGSYAAQDEFMRSLLGAVSPDMRRRLSGV